MKGWPKSAREDSEAQADDPWIWLKCDCCGDIFRYEAVKAFFMNDDLPIEHEESLKPTFACPTCAPSLELAT